MSPNSSVSQGKFPKREDSSSGTPFVGKYFRVRMRAREPRISPWGLQGRIPPAGQVVLCVAHSVFPGEHWRYAYKFTWMDQSVEAAGRRCFTFKIRGETSSVAELWGKTYLKELTGLEALAGVAESMLVFTD